MSFAEGTPTVEITLGGKSYTLGWTNGSKRRYRDWLVAHGVDPKADNSLAENMGVVVWASMDKEARTSLSAEDVEEMIHPGNETGVVEKFASLFALSEPDPEVKAQPVAVTRPTTGKSTSNESGLLLHTT